MENMPNLPPEIAAALVKAQADSQSVGKDAENKFQRYRYASAEALITEGREAMRGAGLALLALGSEFKADEFKTGAGDKEAIGRVTTHYMLLHSSGQCVRFDSSSFVVPEKGRPADKAELAAITANLGYTIRGLLMLPREDADGAVDQRDDRNYDRRPTQRQEPQAARAEAPAADPAHDGLAAEFIRCIDMLPDLKDFGATKEAVLAAKLPKPLLDKVMGAFFIKGFSFAGDAGELEGWIDLIKDANLNDRVRDEVRDAYNARADKFTAKAA